MEYTGKKRVNLNDFNSKNKKKKYDDSSCSDSSVEKIPSKKTKKSKEIEKKPKKVETDSDSESKSRCSSNYKITKDNFKNKKETKKEEKKEVKPKKLIEYSSDSESEAPIKKRKKSIKSEKSKKSEHKNKNKKEKVKNDSDSEKKEKDLKYFNNKNKEFNIKDFPKINPYNNKPYSSKFYEILKTRVNLPAWESKKTLFKLIEENQVIVLKGETGSGKTTQIPQFLLEKFNSIAITQPRRVAAMSVAMRVAEEMDVKLGEEVGYSIRFEDMYSQKTILKYLTDGMLLKEAMSDRLLSKYDMIILDECHERTISTEILFGHFKELLQKRPELKLIVMSATIDIEKFQDYFDDAPVLSVSGRLYNVDVKYLDEPCRDYLEEAVDKAVYIHENNSEGDILIFLTGEEEIETACNMLRDSIDEYTYGRCNVIPLYSTLPPGQQQKIFEARPPTNKSGRPGRKIVVSTNIAETSITIDGIVYVIDSGYSKQKVYNPRLRMESLLVSPISQASAKQRKGRAGRTREGICYRLYTEETYKELEKTTYPEILRSNLSTVILTLLKLGVEDIVHFDYMDPPAPETVMRALELLHYMGAIDDKGHLTDDGVIMAHTPLDPELAKVLISSQSTNCTNEILTIVSMLSVPSVFVRPRNQQSTADDAKKKFIHNTGDHLTLLTVYNTFKSRSDSDAFCRQNFLNIKNLKNADNVRNQLQRMIESNGINVPKNTFPLDFNESKANKILKTMLTGCFAQVCHLELAGYYLTVRENQMVLMHPSTVLGYKPSWVLYHDFVCTGQNYIRTISKIKPEWLFELAPEFYNVDEFPKGSVKRALIKVKVQASEEENGKKEDLSKYGIKDEEENNNLKLKEISHDLIKEKGAYAKYSAIKKYKVNKD